MRLAFKFMLDDQYDPKAASARRRSEPLHPRTSRILQRTVVIFEPCARLWILSTCIYIFFRSSKMKELPLQGSRRRRIRMSRVAGLRGRRPGEPDPLVSQALRVYRSQELRATASGHGTYVLARGLQAKANTSLMEKPFADSPQGTQLPYISQTPLQPRLGCCIDMAVWTVDT